MSMRGVVENGTDSAWHFHRSMDGREYIRSLLPLYMAESGISERKIATIIADCKSDNGLSKAENEVLQRREDDSVKSALIRWQKGQRNLFSDVKRSERLIRRLQNLMSNERVLAELFEMRSLNSAKANAASAFSAFYYGADSAGANHPKVRQLFHELQGVFEIFHTYSVGNGSHDSPCENALSSTRYYFCFFREAQLDYTIVHRFKLSGFGDDTRLIVGLKDHASGFAFPLPSGEVHMILADQFPPSGRTYKVLIPTDWYNAESYTTPLREDAAFVCSSTTSLPTANLYGADPEYKSHFGQATVLRRVTERILERSIYNTIEKIKWDVVL